MDPYSVPSSNLFTCSLPANLFTPIDLPLDRARIETKNDSTEPRHKQRKTNKSISKDFVIVRLPEFVRTGTKKNP